MALGVLGFNSGQTDSIFGVTTTIYTCPAAVSHAVVHVYYEFTVDRTVGGGVASIVYLGINGGKFGRLQALTGTTAFKENTGSVSVVLAPGESITVYGQGNNASFVYWDCTVTGYEVP
jgi:hypothetical protein